MQAEPKPVLVPGDTAHRLPDAVQPRVCLSTIGVFHTFDMARQLERAGALASLHTGYPRFKLRDCGLPQRKIRTFPWLHGPYMAGWVPAAARRSWEGWDRAAFDHFVASTLPDGDVYCALSGSGLHSGRAAQRRGMRVVCDRGSSHIRFQDRLLREEYARWDLPYPGIPSSVIDCEEAEYEQADAILVPSRFALRSFVEEGVPAGKLRLAPYGVDLARFSPLGAPRKDAFDLLFVGGLSIRKGARYLIDAYVALTAQSKSLTIAGVVSSEVRERLYRLAAGDSRVRILGHVPQHRLPELMSRAHALVLPSVEDGFGLVMAQAMACGCPVVASRHTGAEDLFTDGVEGRIVEPSDAAALKDALEKLADDPLLRERLSQASRLRVGALGGWERYGATILEVFRSLANGVDAVGLPAGAIV
jgi:glycosyltransferase involved in cell wall biosynthesis